MSDRLELPFDRLPYWRGAHKAPEVPAVTYPFGLRIDEHGLVRQQVVASVTDAIIAAYGSDAYTFITPLAGNSAWATRLAERKISLIDQAMPDVSKKSVLEIGGGSLAVARHLLARGARGCTVIDPTLREPSVRSSITAVRGYFPSREIEGRFDFIVSLDCLEHVPDPVGFLQSIAAHLANGGTCFLSCPDVGRQFREGDLAVLLHEHMTYLDEAGARRLFGLAGLEIVDLQRGNDDYFFFLARKGRMDAAIGAGGEQLLATGTEAFGATVKLVSERVRRLLDAGKSVAFHGANPGLVNFLHAARLGEAPVHIFDGDSSKTGCYVPGAAAPIRHQSDPIYANMDFILVAAVSYADEIIAQALASGHTLQSVRRLQADDLPR